MADFPEDDELEMDDEEQEFYQECQDGLYTAMELIESSG